MKSRSFSRRPEQMAETVRQAVTEALMRGEVRDPRVGLVTVTAVHVSGDASHARVLVAPAGDEPAKERALEGLRSAAGFLRTKVARLLTTRTVPELHFELDRGLEHAARIGALLEELKRAPPD